MASTVSRRGRVGDMLLLIIFAMLFPIMSTLHMRVSSEAYQLLAGILLGGVAALGKALLHDGFQRWRAFGWEGIERTRALRLLVTLLVYPVLAMLSIMIWCVGSAGPNIGMAYDLGALIGGGIMGWRAAVALARKRKQAL
ncbi:TPA: hypothetical protein QDZ75_003589 [Stenotrophomonas maltophilia]|nr:hypothetical protein [Stenotrophomonas maltophilia]